MSFNIADTIEPRSDQQNYEDFLLGPKTVSVTSVKRGNSEQPVELHLAEYPGRPYKPSKSMRRVLVLCWGPDASTYVGRRLELYGDPTIMYGGQQVGGIKISALSDIDKPQKLSLTVRRGKREPHTVNPLAVAAPARGPVVTAQMVDEATDVDLLRGLWKQADPDVKALIQARVLALETPAEPVGVPDMLDPARDAASPFEGDDK